MHADALSTLKSGCSLAKFGFYHAQYDFYYGAEFPWIHYRNSLIERIIDDHQAVKEFDEKFTELLSLSPPVRSVWLQQFEVEECISTRGLDREARLLSAIEYLLCAKNMKSDDAEVTRVAREHVDRSFASMMNFRNQAVDFHWLTYGLSVGRDLHDNVHVHCKGRKSVRDAFAYKVWIESAALWHEKYLRAAPGSLPIRACTREQAFELGCSRIYRFLIRLQKDKNDRSFVWMSAAKQKRVIDGFNKESLLIQCNNEYLDFMPRLVGLEVTNDLIESGKSGISETIDEMFGLCISFYEGSPDKSK